MNFYDQIFDNNRRWAASKKAGDQHFFEQLAQSQSPEILYIGCSDSRVSAEEMTGLLEKAEKVIPADQLWVNPDCGLKTRGWAEVEPALVNLVKAAKTLRDKRQKEAA